MQTTQLWTLRHVARAVNTTPKTLSKWLEHGVVRLTTSDRAAAGSGSRTGLCYRRAIQFAFIHELTRLGVKSSTASVAALRFSDCGSPGRPLGQLFINGSTYLVLKDNASASVVNVAAYDSIFDVVGDSPAIALLCNTVVEKVNAALGINQPRRSA